MVGHHKFQQLAPDAFRILGQVHVQCRGIPLEARPVALPREGNALGNAQRTKDAPAREQPYLSRSEAKLGGLLNLVVVKNESVQHTLILPRRAGGGTSGRAPGCTRRSLMHRANWGTG
jgi:hypothetical protein